MFKLVNLLMLWTSLIQPSAGRAPISNPGMSEAGNFSGNNFIPANGLTVAQNQVNNGVAPDFARCRAVNCYFLNGAKYLTHFFLIKRFSLDRRELIHSSYWNLSDFNLQVLNLIKACPRPEGLNFQDLKNQLQHMSVASIKWVFGFCELRFQNVPISPHQGFL